MFNKIKKYFLLIPLIMVLCFNFCVYGSVQAVDYSAYFHPWEECPYDFRFSPENPTYISIDCPISSGTRDLYFYAVFMDSTQYDNYLNGLNYKLFVRVYDFYNPDSVYPTVKTENDYFIRFHYLKDIRLWTYSYDVSTGSFSKNVSSSTNTTTDFIYFKNSGQIRTVPYDAPDSDYFNDGSSVGSHFFMQYTNYPGFDLVNFENESSLDVRVCFSPDLTGSVDRSVTLDDGSTALKNCITLSVYNRSDFDVQYQMHIYRKEDYPEIGGVAPGVYPVFTYYEKDWVYARGLESNADWWNKVEKQYKATDCHLVWSGRTDVVTFYFNQLPLSEGVDYTVVVTAVRNDYKFASEHYVQDWEEFYPDLFQVQGSQIVFRSDFSMKQYSDVKYDRNNTNNGVLPYQGKDDKQQYDNSYYAKEDDSGNVDYEGKDVYNDPSSWYNNDLNHNFDPSGKWYDGLVGDKESGGSSDGTFTSFASSFTNYFQFLSYIFNYFPVGFKNVFLIGFVGIMVVVLVKVIFK